MKSGMKKCTLRATVSLLLAVVTIFSTVAPAFATQPKKTKTTIKVAFYQLDGFFEYDEDGNPCGYGVDYLNELKKYENIEWEYVPVDSWEGIKPLMLNGDVDVRMPVSEPTTPSQLYDYTVEPMMLSYHAIMTLDSRNDLYYHDYDLIETLKIGVCDNLLEKTGVESYLQSIGVVSNLIFYPDYNSCRSALDDGEVDALISNVMDLTDDMKILDKFSVVDNYITTLKGNPCYTIINDAMTQLKLENPSFQSSLYQKYFPERALEPFSKEECEYIASTPSITVAVYPNRKPVSYVDNNGEFRGTAIELANLISEKIGIHFTYIPIVTDTQTGMLDRADIVMPVPEFISSDDYFVTQSILDTEILMAVHSGKDDLKDGSRIGVLTTTPGIISTLENLNRFELVKYDNNRDAFNALQRGKIDAFANSSQVINWMLQNPRYTDLDTLRYQSFPLTYSICGKAEDTILQSLLSKAIQTITDDERDEIIQSSTKLEMDDFTISDRLYVYRIQILGLGVVLLLLIVFLILNNRTRSKYYRQIEESNRKLEKASIAKSEFLSRMSHDMRTPMNGILGITNLLRDRTDPTEMKEDIAQIEMSANYLMSLINDTLDMSKIEAGKMELHPEPISSKDLCNNVISTVGILAQQKGVKLITDLPSADNGGWLPVIADSARVEQIFINIISNAIKFTPKDGTVRLQMETIAVSDTTVQDRYIISDTGIGMNEAFQKHIFEPFAQEGRTNNSGESGTGLGLAIVKQIVDLMGGSIRFESKENEGTTFIVELSYPRYFGEIIKSSSQHKDWSKLNGKRILLCEVHPVNAKIAIRLLEKQQMTVERAENGEIGVEMFSRSAEHYYDAILMDIRMPVMNGIEATKAIRAIPDRSDALEIPIIAMTANAFDEDREQTKAVGMNEHLAKPIEPALLYNTLVICIENMSASDENLKDDSENSNNDN